MSELSTNEDLHWADWLVFSLFLVGITVVGVVIGVINRRKSSSKDFLQASSQMHYFPVTLSIQASFLSSIFVVSLPAECYLFGIAYVYLGFSYLVAFPLIGKLFFPVYFRLKVSSAYEYLEIRFNTVVRVAASVVFLMEMVLYISVAIYTPALIIEQVSPIPTWGSIIMVSTVSLIYTVTGGMRATIWNDVIQMTVIMVMLVFMIGFGQASAGSLLEVYQIAKNGSRMNFNVFAPEPTTQTTFWTQFLGGTFLNFAMYASSQTVIQKAMSTRSIEDAQRSMNALAGTYLVFLILVMWLGIVMYVYYVDCDPLLAGYINKPDQLVPKFMMDILGDYHGVPGLFIAAIFSGALSTVSGGLNSMAGVCYLDFVVPLYLYMKADRPSEIFANIITRLFVLIWGIIVTVMAFISPYMGELVLSIALSIFGMVGGPICGVIISGIFMPCVNPWGALSGLVISLGISLWLGIGTMVSGREREVLPVSVAGCPDDNFYNMTTEASTTFDPTTTALTASFSEEVSDDILGFYKVSTMYYGLISIGICMITSALVSAVIGVQKDVPYSQIYSCSDLCCQCSCCSPEARECFRCGALPPDDDEINTVEVVEVHFKKTSDDPVIADYVGKHPVRQLSYTLYAGRDLVHPLPEMHLDDREKDHIVGNSLYHNHTIKEVHQNIPTADSIGSGSENTDDPCASGSKSSESTSALSVSEDEGQESTDERRQYLEIPKSIIREEGDEINRDTKETRERTSRQQNSEGSLPDTPRKTDSFDGESCKCEHLPQPKGGGSLTGSDTASLRRPEDDGLNNPGQSERPEETDVIRALSSVGDSDSDDVSSMNSETETTEKPPTESESRPGSSLTDPDVIADRTGYDNPAFERDESADPESRDPDRDIEEIHDVNSSDLHTTCL